jgi:hypothetical protein
MHCAHQYMRRGQSVGAMPLLRAQPLAAFFCHRSVRHHLRVAEIVMSLAECDPLPAVPSPLHRFPCTLWQL